MTKTNPFSIPHPIPGADQLSAEDKRQIDIVAELAAAIFAHTAAENGFTDAEVTRARKDTRDLFTSFVVDQRSAGLEP